MGKAVKKTVSKGKGAAPAAGKVGVAKPGAVGSIRQLAAAVGKSQTAVAGWVKHPSWTFGAGPWPANQVEQIKDWARRALSPDPAATAGQSQPRRKLTIADLDPKQQMDLLLKEQKLKQEKFKAEREQGLYHRIDECEQRLVQQAHEIKTRLLQIPDSLPVTSDVRDMVRGAIIAALTQLSRQGR